MATEYPRLGIARSPNPAAFGPQAGAGDLFARAETAAADDVEDDGARLPGDRPADGWGGGSWPGAAHPSFEAKAEIWRDFREGRISLAEAQRRSAKIGVLAREPARPVRLMHGAPGKPRPPVARPRQARPEPNESRQYANPMATTAARDDRLTPQAKALLQIIRARSGKGARTVTTKATLAAILSRSTRSITRYLRDLERCGYLRTRTRADSRGFHLGLVLTITEKVLPFFAETRRLARWLGEVAGARPFMPFSAETPAGARFETPGSRPAGPVRASQDVVLKGVTLLSSKNHVTNDSSYQDSNGLRRYTRQAPGGGG